MSDGPPDLLRRAADIFAREFDYSPTLSATAPGRINIIGEHTDYNNGYVLPMAIDRWTVVAGAVRSDGVVRAYTTHGECMGLANLANLAEPAAKSDGTWMDAIAAVAREVHPEGTHARGADLALCGNLPIGAGLSSSASFEMAVLSFFEQLHGISIDDSAAALLCQRVENEALGLQCGLMDPLVIRSARSGHALFLDCGTLEMRHIPAELGGACFVVADTCVARSLSGSKYNERVDECAQALAAVNACTSKNASSLSELTLDDLEAARGSMPATPYQRARHVLTENQRTRDAATALTDSDYTSLGTLIDASHESLARDYAVSCTELDLMCEIARAHDRCYGARMTGAGFGGCTINLVEKGSVADFATHLENEYTKQTGITPKIFPVHPVAGTAHQE